MLEVREIWKRNDMVPLLNEFYQLYLQRPIKDNSGGMKSAHMFNTWFILKALQPAYIIESGVWMGQGTWFFEKACPESKIISIDPNPHFRKYTNEKVKYTSQDFLAVDYWSNLIDPSDALVFFDDHQNSVYRTLHCKKHGFKHVIFEDNYPSNQGDCCTPKKILSRGEYVIDANGVRTFYPHNPKEYEVLSESVNFYQELPPIFKDSKTRWGDDWDDKYETPEPLLDHSKKNEFPIFFEERFDYTWICYLNMNG